MKSETLTGQVWLEGYRGGHCAGSGHVASEIPGPENYLKFPKIRTASGLTLSLSCLCSLEFSVTTQTLRIALAPLPPALLGAGWGRMRDSSLQRRDQDSKPPAPAQMLGVSCPARVRSAHARIRRGLAGRREGRREERKKRRRREEGVRGAGYRPGQRNGAEIAQPGPRRQPAHLLSSAKSHSPSPPQRANGHNLPPPEAPRQHSESLSSPMGKAVLPPSVGPPALPST